MDKLLALILLASFGCTSELNDFATANFLGCDAVEVSKDTAVFSNSTEELEFRRAFTEAAYYRLSGVAREIKVYELLDCP